jgi:hypothetical protein
VDRALRGCSHFRDAISNRCRFLESEENRRESVLQSCAWTNLREPSCVLGIGITGGPAIGDRNAAWRSTRIREVQDLVAELTLKASRLLRSDLP